MNVQNNISNENWYKMVQSNSFAPIVDNSVIQQFCNNRFAGGPTETSCLDAPFSHSSSCGKLNSRKRIKRRGVSPKVFPYKVRVTEDRVAKDLFNLQLSSPSNYQKRQRSLSEIESSLSLGSESEDEATDEENIKIQISDEFQNEIDKFRRNLMQGKSNNNSSTISKPETCQALVVWKPPLLPFATDDNEIEKIESNSELGAPEKFNDMDVQFENTSSAKSKRPQGNYRDVAPFVSSSSADNSLDCNNFDYDDAMEL